MSFIDFDIEKAIDEQKVSDSEFKKQWEESRIEYELISDLIKARKAANLTQKDLADMINCNQQKISRIETKEHSPGLKTICRIADALGYYIKIEKKSDIKKR